MILTDPQSIDDELLLKPFSNNLKVHYCEINPAVTFSDLNAIINNLQPKHIITPYASVPEENKQMLDDPISNYL